MLLFTISYVSDLRTIPYNSKYPGQWEIGASSVYENDTLYLINNDPSSRGYAWLSPKFPLSNWTTNITFYFPQQKDQIEIGIWLTKDFGVQGPICGGPLSFYGVAILATYYQGIFSIEYREDDGKSKNRIGFFPCYQEMIKNTTFRFDFDYHYPYLAISMVYRILVENKTVTPTNQAQKKTFPYDFVLYTTKEDNQEYRYVRKHIFYDRPRLKLPRPFISLTAQNHAVDPVIVTNISFPEGYKFTYKTPQQTPKPPVKQQISNLTQISNHKNETSTTTESSHFLKRGKKSQDQNSISSIYSPIILNSFSILFEAASGLGTLDDLKKVLSWEMLPLTQSWQRRALLMEDHSKNLSQMLSQQLNYTKNLLNDSKNQLHDISREMDKKINEIVNELYLGIMKNYDLSHYLDNEEKSSYKGNEKFMLIFSFIEMFVIGILMFNEKLIHFFQKL